MIFFPIHVFVIKNVISECARQVKRIKNIHEKNKKQYKLSSWGQKLIKPQSFITESINRAWMANHAMHDIRQSCIADQGHCRDAGNIYYATRLAIVILSARSESPCHWVINTMQSSPVERPCFKGRQLSFRWCHKFMHMSSVCTKAELRSAMLKHDGCACVQTLCITVLYVDGIEPRT